MNEWTRIRVECPLDKLEQVGAIMSMVETSIQIEDYSDLESVYGELVDESIKAADKTRAAVSVYVPEECNPADSVAFLKERFAASGLEKLEITCNGVSEDDWAVAWKKYYKILHIGERIVIVPAWEEYTPAPGEAVVKMDPGMAFGTGTHETTRMCAGLLETYVKPGCRFLDVGTGSGILSIIAMKLGAASALGVDIDPVAVRVAKENAVENGVDAEFRVSDLLSALDNGSQYDLACANIVADVIVRMAPDIGRFIAPGGVIITSGIIDAYRGNVVDALTAHGFELLCEHSDNDWDALVFVKR